MNIKRLLKNFLCVILPPFSFALKGGFFALGGNLKKRSACDTII